MDIDAIAALMWQLYTNAVAENVGVITPLCDWERVPEKSRHAWKQLATLFAQPSADSEPTQQLFPKAEELLRRLRDGGALVGSGICSDHEIANAQARGDFATDDEGFGYVMRSEAWRTSREISHSKMQELACQRIVVDQLLKLIPEVSGG